MKIIFLGPPGAGKGTQSRLICQKHNLPQISPGDILRQAVSKKTLLGRRAQSYMDQGALVPDEVILGIVEERLKQSDCQAGYILDGFPRTIPQADALEEMLEAGIDYVLLLELSEADLIKRLSGRRVCENCGEEFHIKFKPSFSPGICDHCGGNLIQRSDASEEAVKKRFVEYKEKTSPLVDYYEKQGKLHSVSGSGDIAEIFARIRRVLASD